MEVSVANLGTIPASADSVTLLFNGHTIATNAVTAADWATATFTVPYQPGELTTSRDALAHVRAEMTDARTTWTASGGRAPTPGMACARRH